MWPAIVPIAIIATGAIAMAKLAKTKKSHTPLTSLAGSEWGPASGGEQFIAFKSGGELVGFGGCNNVFGNYAQDGTSLTIGPLAMTKKLCPDAMAAEGAFISALERAQSFDATHVKLSIRDEDQKIILSLNRRDWD